MRTGYEYRRRRANQSPGKCWTLTELRERIQQARQQGREWEVPVWQAWIDSMLNGRQAG